MSDFEFIFMYIKENSLLWISLKLVAPTKVMRKKKTLIIYSCNKCKREKERGIESLMYEYYTLIFMQS